MFKLASNEKLVLLLKVGNFSFVSLPGFYTRFEMITRIEHLSFNTILHLPTRQLHLVLDGYHININCSIIYIVFKVDTREISINDESKVTITVTFGCFGLNLSSLRKFRVIFFFPGTILNYLSCSLKTCWPKNKLLPFLNSFGLDMWKKIIYSCWSKSSFNIL